MILIIDLRLEISVEFSPNGDGTWIPFSHTETIQSRKNCSFFTAFSFYPQNNINPKSLLKFTFKRMRRTDQVYLVLIT